MEHATGTENKKSPLSQYSSPSNVVTRPNDERSVLDASASRRVLLSDLDPKNDAEAEVDATDEFDTQRHLVEELTKRVELMSKYCEGYGALLQDYRTLQRQHEQLGSHVLKVEEQLAGVLASNPDKVQYINFLEKRVMDLETALQKERKKQSKMYTVNEVEKEMRDIKLKLAESRSMEDRTRMKYLKKKEETEKTSSSRQKYKMPIGLGGFLSSFTSPNKDSTNAFVGNLVSSLTMGSPVPSPSNSDNKDKLSSTGFKTDDD